LVDVALAASQFSIAAGLSSAAVAWGLSGRPPVFALGIILPGAVFLVRGISARASMHRTSYAVAWRDWSAKWSVWTVVRREPRATLLGAVIGVALGIPWLAPLLVVWIAGGVP
jgi:hypothetical protein